MRRRRKNPEKTIKKAIGILVTAGVVLFFFKVSHCFLPFFQWLTARAAVFSAGVSLPDGAARSLKLYFSSEKGKESENKSELSEAWSDSSFMESDTLKVGSYIPQLEEEPVILPEIPEKNRGQLLQEQFYATAGGIYVPFGAGIIRNSTKLNNNTVLQLTGQEMPFQLENTDEPQVLIYHTHATEAFEPYDRDIYDISNTWRSTDNSQNMIAVGNAITDALEKQGIGVIHDTTQHDYPSYNGAYDRSSQTVSSYLEQYPSIKVVLDVHRDGIQRNDTTIVKPTAIINGKKCAQIMIISGCDDGSIGMPEWKKNFAFAIRFQDSMESRFPGLTRPLMFCYRRYNMHLSPGSLLVEFGSQANTLEEAVYAGQLAGEALGELLNSTL